MHAQLSSFGQILPDASEAEKSLLRKDARASVRLRATNLTPTTMSFPCSDAIEAWTDDTLVICPPPSPAPPPLSPSVLSFEGPLFAPEADDRNLFRLCVLLLILLLLRCLFVFQRTRESRVQSARVLAMYEELVTQASETAIRLKAVAPCAAYCYILTLCCCCSRRLHSIFLLGRRERRRRATRLSPRPSRR